MNGQPTVADVVGTLREVLPANRAEELRRWWLELADAEATRVIPKAVEYGADDLEEIGREMCLAFGRPVPSTQECVELGIFFYMVGKMARWRSAIRRDDRPSDDTLHDIGVYVRMTQRTRDVGGWPFGD